MKQLLLLLFFIQINLLSAQSNVYVSAENGLIVRDKANKNANRIGKFEYAEELEVLEKTNTYLEITDNGKTIKAEWYKVTRENFENKTLTGYVFSGFLTKSPPKDTVEFVNNNDDGDYAFLTAKNNDAIVAYYYRDDIEGSYLRGDTIEIEWKKRTLIEAGDNDITYNVKQIISIKKVKDGCVSMFRTRYKKDIKYDDLTDSYSNSYLAKLYLDIEYYIANTTNRLINIGVKEQQPLAFSIEDRNWNDKAYVVVKIFQSFENKQTTFQWLFISQETGMLFEYDLPNDKLTEFK